MTAMTQTYFMTGRHVRALLRQPWYIAASLSQPVIWLVLFGALFSGVTAIPGFGGSASYIDYLVPAILVMTALFSCGWSGMGIIEDLDRGIMDRFLVSPVHRSAIITGRTLYEMMALLVQALIIGGLALVLGARFAGGPLGFAVLVACAMLVGAAFSSFSDAMALRIRQRESVIGVNTMLVLPLTFLSAAFMPLVLVPDWIATVAHVNPVNWAIEAGREAMLAGPDWTFVLPRVGGLLIVTALAMWWATRTFHAYQRSI